MKDKKKMHKEKTQSRLTIAAGVGFAAVAGLGFAAGVGFAAVAGMDFMVG